MKILKIIAIILGVLVLIALILGLMGPKTYDVHRSTVVAASPDQVWPYLSSLKNMALWSPWAEKDTNMVVEYTGTDGAVGSMNSWSGNKDVGKGSQTMTLLEPNAYAESQLKFFEPMEAEATAYTRLSDTTGGTLVTWGLKGENGFMGRIMSSVMSMDKMMADDFERGLTKLSELVAATPKKASNSPTVTPGEYPGGKYLGVRASMSIGELKAFFGKNFGTAFDGIGKGGATPAGMPSGLYYDWNMEKGTTDVAAAAPFSGDIKKAPDGLQVITLPASKSLTVDYYGGYSGVGSAHNAIDAYIKENKLEQLTPVIEEYITDPMTEPDSAKWLTKVVYFVK